MVARLPRRHSALLFQLRTGHAPLRKHLACIGKADSPTCSRCRAARETVTHYLLDCPAYERARRTLFYEVGRASRCVAQLFSNPELTRPLFRFIHRTKRFEEHFGDTWMDNETAEEKEKEGQKENAKKKPTRDRAAQNRQPVRRMEPSQTRLNFQTITGTRKSAAPSQRRQPATMRGRAGRTR